MRLLSILLAAFFFIAEAGAQTSPPAPMPVPGLGAPLGHLSSGHQYYDMSASGLQKYLDQLRQDDETAYNTLKPQFESFITRTYVGNGVMWGSIGVGLGMVVASMSFAQTESRETDSFGDEEIVESPNNDLGTAGAVIAILGGFSGYLLTPDREDLLDLINKHNRVRPATPLQMGIGFIPTWDSRRAFGLSLAYKI